MTITNKAELNAAIIELKERKLFQEQELIAQFKATREILTPLNLIKEGIGKLADAPGLTDGILKTVAGVGAAFLSKKIFVGGSSSIIKKALGAVLEFTVAKSAINNADKIKSFGISLYNNLFKKKGKKQVEETNY